MGSIYSMAERVLIWAGRDENQQAATAFSVLSMIAGNSGGDENAHDFPSLSLIRMQMKSLREFYEIPWFRRLRVIQEVVLSSSAVML